MSKKCLHKNIIIRTQTRYEIPKGWEWLMDQEDVDLTKWESSCCEQDSVFCEDCGEYLDD